MAKSLIGPKIAGIGAAVIIQNRQCYVSPVGYGTLSRSFQQIEVISDMFIWILDVTAFLRRNRKRSIIAVKRHLDVIKRSAGEVSGCLVGMSCDRWSQQVLKWSLSTRLPVLKVIHLSKDTTVGTRAHLASRARWNAILWLRNTFPIDPALKEPW